MKRVLIILFIFISIKSFGQLPNTLPQGSEGLEWWQRGITGADLGIRWRLSFADTTAANNYKSGLLKNISGFVIRVVDDYWSRSNDLTKWNKINGGVGGGGIVSLGTTGAYGLVLVNDSTYRVDTLAISTVDRLYEVADSIAALITGGSTDTALIKTIVSDSNQLKANVNLNNLSISSIIETNIGHGVKDIANRNGKWVKGGVIYAYMDSYGTGTGASSVSKGWVQLFTSALGADLINYSVQGTSMEKRVPIDLINSPNMVDDTVNIPVKTYNDRLLIIARATNDVIINSPNYNSANYFSDGSLVVQAALNKGWDSSQILLVGPYWLGVNGFMQGGGVSGTPVATLSRQDSFLNAARQLSQTFHTLFFDIREAQRRFDTTHIMAADQLHPNDTGHAFIAAAILQYLNLQYSSATGGINTLIDVFFNHTTNITNTDTAWFATSGAGYGQTGL